jgi:hypothetical protein
VKKTQVLQQGGSVLKETKTAVWRSVLNVKKALS